jgi:hypothetical protein
MVCASRWFRSLTVCVVVALGAMGSLAPANAANPQEKPPVIGLQYYGWLPACDAVLGMISWRFALKEGRFWATGLRLVGWENVRETAFRHWAGGTIPRRFCSAVAQVNDGTKHDVHYWIGEGTGFAGAWSDVEWCVVGLDHNWAYNPNCKMAKP